MLYNKFVEFIELSLNNSCSLQCQGCPSLSPNHPNIRELDFEKAFAIIKDFNPKEIFICGNDGEPLEHSRIDFILQTLGERYTDNDILIATNGELLDKLDLKSLTKYRNIVFQVAIDGPNQSIHEQTRVGGKLEKVLKNIEYANSFGIKVEPIYSRHLNNEGHESETYKMVHDRLGLELIFRDTTIVTKNIKPPKKRSELGNMTFLYEKSYNKKVKPWFKRIYVNSDGNCYPCVSFIYAKTKLTPVSIYNFKHSFDFYSGFIKFSKSFCDCYQSLGNTTQCKLNCDFYMSEFGYDSIESIGKLS